MAVESTGAVTSSRAHVTTPAESSHEAHTRHSKRKVTRFSPLELFKNSYQRAKPRVKGLLSRKVAHVISNLKAKPLTPLPRQAEARATSPEFQAGKVKSAPDLSTVKEGRLLGEGAFGKVYEANNKPEPVQQEKMKLTDRLRSKLGLKIKIKDISSPTHLSKNYVVKRQALKGTEEEKTKQLAGIERETRIQNLAPGTAPILASRTDTKNSYHETMMLHSGASLSEAMGKFTESGDREAGALPKEINYAVGKQLVNQLSDVHSAGVIHRDIKAENVLIDGQGKAALIDYGNALHSDKTDPSLARVSGTAGSAIYMAPEMIEGKKYGQKADVWSMGMLLAEMATGKEPPVPNMEVNDDGRTLKKISVNDKRLALFKSRLSRSPHLSPALKDLLKGMLERDPDKRLSAHEAAAHPYFSETKAIEARSSPQLQSDYNTLFSELVRTEQALASVKQSGADSQELETSIKELGGQLKELQKQLDQKNIDSQISTLEKRIDTIEERLFKLRHKSKLTRKEKREVSALEQQQVSIPINIQALKS